MNIDLDSRERWDATPIGGLYVHVVEGDRVPCQTCEQGGHDLGMDEPVLHTGWESWRVAPKLWVALSEQKCESNDCRGGEVSYPEWEGRVESCPDCLGSGRPLVQVTVPHPFFGLRGDYAPESDRLSIGSVTVEAVVPIFDRCPDYSPADHICVAWGDGWYWHRDGRTNTEIPLGQDLEQYVGKFGVIVRRVSWGDAGAAEGEA